MEHVLLQHFGARELPHSKMIDQDAGLSLGVRSHEVAVREDFKGRSCGGQLALIQQVQKMWLPTGARRRWLRLLEDGH